MSTIALKSPSGTVNLIPEDIAGTHNVTIPSAGIVSPASLRTELNASGSAPIYACRAWVNFNGTGTVAIRASGNVSSVTDNGTGNYTVNFITAMEDINYSFPNGNYGLGLNLALMLGIYAKTVSSISFNTHVAGIGGYNSNFDSTEITLNIVR